MAWIRIFINIISICIQIAINQLIAEIQDTPICQYHDDWKLQQIKTLTNIMIIVNILNMFVSLNKNINGIPLIGGSVGLVFGFFLVLEAGLVSKLAGDISSGCTIKGYDWLINVIESQSTIAWCIYATGAAIIQLYF
jgi:hypothetical protein